MWEIAPEDNSSLNCLLVTMSSYIAKMTEGSWWLTLVEANSYHQNDRKLS